MVNIIIATLPRFICNIDDPQMEYRVALPWVRNIRHNLSNCIMLVSLHNPYNQATSSDTL